MESGCATTNRLCGFQIIRNTSDMSTHPKTAEWQEMMDGLQTLMNEGSPIAMPILAAAMLEEQVSRTIEKIMPGVDRMNHALRVSILHRMGVISENVASALKSFASIRNCFAHSPHKLTLESQKVAALADTLAIALKAESAETWDTFGAQFHAMMKTKYVQFGAQPNWKHPVPQTLISAFMMLTFYIIWERHSAPTPQGPKPYPNLSRRK